MKTASAFAVTFAFCAMAMGCNTESSRSVDADSALGTFKNPTGSFTKETGAQAFSSYKSEKSESSKVSKPGGSGGTRTQSLRLLTKTLDAESSCAEGQACPCSGGGTVSYAQESSSAGASLHFTFDRCLESDNTGFDGEAIFLVTKEALLGVATSASPAPKAPSNGDAPSAGDDGADPSESGGDEGGLREAQPDDSFGGAESGGDQNYLFAAKGAVIEGNTSTDVEFALVYEAGYTLLAVEVKDGKIVLGLAPDGTAFVKAKQGSYVCKPSSTKGYTCKSSSGDEEIEVAEDAEAPADPSEAPSEDPSSSDDLSPPDESDAGSGEDDFGF